MEFITDICYVDIVQTHRNGTWQRIKRVKNIGEYNENIGEYNENIGEYNDDMGHW